MSLFFLAFFTIYGAIHAYLYVRARQAFAFGLAPGAVLAVFMLAMILSPVVIRLLERYEFGEAAQALSWVSYLWMAALFLFFCISIALTVFNLVLRGASWAGTDALSALFLPPRHSFFIAAGASLVICAFGYASALEIRTEYLTLATAKLPPGIHRLKIVQVSDIHLGLIVRGERLKKIIGMVEAEKPDILVSTGDLVDAQIDHMTGLAELFRNVATPYGKYAIPGNHEYYAGIKQALAFTREAGFKVLRGEAVRSVINIVGVDDPAGQQMKMASSPVSEKTLLSGLRKDRFTLLLKHRPAADPQAVGLFDLQLSGHTHKGQIYPFNYIVDLAYPLLAGYYNLGNGSHLRVSRGTGTWGPPIRVLSPPEISVIELVQTGS